MKQPIQIIKLGKMEQKKAKFSLEFTIYATYKSQDQARIQTKLKYRIINK